MSIDKDPTLTVICLRSKIISKSKDLMQPVCVCVFCSFCGTFLWKEDPEEEKENWVKRVSLSGDTVALQL